MLGAKVELKHAEKIKKDLVKKELVEFSYLPLKTNKHIIFPLKKDSEKKIKETYVKIVKETFKKKNKKSWKNLLEKILTKEEISELITAHDVVGSIAILEIPDKLVSKEKLIAQSLLKANRNITTILKKAGEHSGTFRTQKMNWLAGIDTRETIHKENNAQIKINVEEVYFSARLSSERKRISQQVKEGENILVMFSGAAPYPMVLSKNTKANSITGIEINPLGHKLGEENIKINKTGNVSLICADANILPNLYKQIIGLKSRIDHTSSRMKEKPPLYEFFLSGNESVLEIKEAIKKVKKNGVKEVWLHMPHQYKGKPTYIDEAEEEFIRYFTKILDKTKANGVMHLTDKGGKKLDENMKLLKKHGLEKIYFENVINKYFNSEQSVLKTAKKYGMKNICVDVAHHFAKFENNDSLIKFIKTIKKNYNTYFHLNDANKGDDGLEIEKGEIDFKRVMPLVNKGLIEVKSEDEKKGTEMINDYKQIISSKPTYDRICMPLPKSAEDFLRAALSVAKPGTIIHFYDFLHEDEFEKCESKVKKACKKAGFRYEVLEFVKCGQYSPRKFRVCLDFKTRAP